MTREAEENLKAVLRILARGGRLVVAKNVALPQQEGGMVKLGLGFLIPVEVSKWLPPDTILAVAPPPRLRDLVPAPSVPPGDGGRG